MTMTGGRPRPATSEALIRKHVTGSRTCPLEAPARPSRRHHAHHVKEYPGGTHQ